MREIDTDRKRRERKIMKEMCINDEKVRRAEKVERESEREKDTYERERKKDTYEREREREREREKLREGKKADGD
jgi:hypothetical protein